MNQTAHLLLILLGGPVAIGGPPLLAVWLCGRHANQSAAAIREHFRDDQAAPVAAVRPKELTR